MRGRWKISRDRFLLLSPEIWIIFEAGDRTVYNYMGQALKVLDAQQAQAKLDSLGLDIMNEKCARFDISEVLSGQEKPIGELLVKGGVKV
jgi:hypothetical protein